MYEGAIMKDNGVFQKARYSCGWAWDGMYDKIMREEATKGRPR